MQHAELELSGDHGGRRRSSRARPVARCRSSPPGSRPPAWCAAQSSARRRSCRRRRPARRHPCNRFCVSVGAAEQEVGVGQAVDRDHGRVGVGDLVDEQRRRRQRHFDIARDHRARCGGAGVERPHLDIDAVLLEKPFLVGDVKDRRARTPAGCRAPRTRISCPARMPDRWTPSRARAAQYEAHAIRRSSCGSSVLSSGLCDLSRSGVLCHRRAEIRPCRASLISVPQTLLAQFGEARQRAACRACAAAAGRSRSSRRCCSAGPSARTRGRPSARLPRWNA